jgi:peptidoglycan/xylan/chitin deacetylase (PgdA/CDA1 family)
MNLLVLTYHYFHEDKPSGIKKEDYSFSLEIDNFEDHCREIASSGYHLVEPDRMFDRDQYRGKPDRQVLMTIDDGHKSIESAADIILKYRISPVLNVIPRLIGHDNYLTWSSLRDLTLKGFSIQSHSVSHHDLTRLNRMELTAELEQSKKIIEDNIGLPVKMLAAPMGRINRRVVETALEAGYEVIMTSFAGINKDRDDLKFLRRVQIKRRHHSLAIDNYYRPVSRVRIEGAARNLAKKIRNRLF